MLTIRNSYIFSVSIQILSLIIFYIVRQQHINPELILLHNAFYLEYVVSIIEFIIYLVLGLYLNTKTNMTAIRYIDWFATTNMLLISLSLFLLFNKIKFSDKNEEDKIKELKKYDFTAIKDEYSDLFIKIISFNTLMLVFGFLGEINLINKHIALGLGLLVFGVSFKLIYENFVGNVIFNKIFISVFIFIWLLYAVAFMLDYKNKNIAYNLLDLVSKNFFGLFLFCYIYLHNMEK